MKNTLIFLFLLLLSYSSTAQGWEKTYNFGNSQAVDIVKSTNGTIWGLSNKTVSLDSLTILLFQVNEAGHLEATYEFSDSLQLSAYVMEATTDGGIAIGGQIINEDKGFLLKIDSLGNEEWRRYYPGYGSKISVTDILQTSTGELLLTVHNTISDSRFQIIKTDAEGNTIWLKHRSNFVDLNSCGATFCVLRDKLGNIRELDENRFLMSGGIARMNVTNQGIYISTDYFAYLLEIDADGNEIFEDYRPNTRNYLDLTQTTHDDLWAISSNLENKSLDKISPTGDLISQINLPSSSHKNHVKATNDNNFILAYNLPNTTAYRPLILEKRDSIGTILWHKEYRYFNQNTTANLFIDNNNNSYLIGTTTTDDNSNIFLIKTDANGIANSNKIKGFVFYDANENCAYDAGESPLVNYQINIDELIDYPIYSDSTGYFSTLVHSGNYTISPVPIDSDWISCPSFFTQDFTSSFDSIYLEFAIRDTCPAISSSIFQNPICGEGNGEIYISSEGGIGTFSYEWSNGEMGEVAHNLSTGTYMVTVTSGNCSAIETFDFAGNADLNLFGADTIVCEGTELSFGFNNFPLTGYTYAWADGNMDNPRQFIVSEDTLLQVIISSPEGCTGISNIFVNADNFEIEGTVNEANCAVANGDIQINTYASMGAVNFNWNTGSTQADLLNIPAGTYTLTASDNNCTIEETFVVNEMESPLYDAGGSIFGGSSSSPTFEAPLWRDLSFIDNSMIGIANYLDATRIMTRSTTLPSAKTLPYSNLKAMYKMLDGGFIVAGQTDDNDDILLVKTNHLFEVDTTFIFGGEANDFFGDLTVLANGDIIICGYTNSSDGIFSDNYGGQDGFVTRLDGDFNIVWNKNIGGSNNDAIIELELLSDGTIIAGGSGLSTDGNVPESLGGRDRWIVQLNSETGDISNFQVFGGSDDDKLVHLKVLNDEIISSGHSENLNGENGIWTIKTSVAGDIIWENVHEGNYGPFDLEITQDNKIVLSPYQNKVIALHPDTGNQVWSKTVPNARFLAPDANLDIRMHEQETTLHYNENNIHIGTSFVDYISYLRFIEFPDEFNLPSDTALCAGDSLEITLPSPTQGFDYVWSEGTINDTILITEPGLYTADLLSHGNCKTTDSIFIDFCDGLEIPEQEPVCNYTILDAGFHNGEYLWSTGDTTYSTYVFDSSWVSLEITLPTGEIYTDSVFVPVLDNDIVIETDFSENLCYLDSTGFINLNITTNYDYSVLWNTGDTTEQLDNLSEGYYRVSVSNEFGCLTIETFEIEDATTPLSGYFFSNPVSCYDSADGTASYFAMGGNLPHSYIWSNGGTENEIENITAGNYYITITDAIGCALVDSITLENPVPPTDVSNFFDFLTDTTLCLPNTISYNANLSDSFNIQWSTGLLSPEITFTEPGQYIANLISPDDCIAALSDTILIDFCNDFKLASPAPNCEELTINAGFQGAEYLWSTGDTTYSTTVTDSSWVSLQMTHPSGEIYIDSVFAAVVENDISASSSYTTEQCGADSTGFIDLTVNTSYDYEVLWNTGEMTEDLDSLTIGDYSVTVTNEFACQKDFSFSIAGVAVNYYLLEEEISCHNAQDGSVQILMFGGSPPFDYLWNTGDTISIISDLSEGNYEVTVTDAADCDIIQSATLNNPDSLIVSVETTNPSSGLSNGLIYLDITGGTPPYNNILGGENVGSIIGGLAASDYNFFLEDTHGCSISFSVLLENISAVQSSFSENVLIFPNPFSDYFEIKMKDNSIPEQLFIYDALGQKMPFTYDGELEIYKQSWNSGVYFVEIKEGKKTTILKVIKL